MSSLILFNEYLLEDLDKRKNKYFGTINSTRRIKVI